MNDVSIMRSLICIRSNIPSTKYTLYAFGLLHNIND